MPLVTKRLQIVIGRPYSCDTSEPYIKEDDDKEVNSPILDDVEEGMSMVFTFKE
jgi:hypothetical protein